jgi:DNA-binding MarR family transcriptional regulator
MKEVRRMCSANVSNLADDVQRLVSKLVRNYQRCDRMCLAEHGVTAAQGYAILTFPSDGSIGMNALSEALGLASSTVTRMVDQLVAKNLVRRRPGDEDRREVLAELTDEGSRLRAGLEEAHRTAFQVVLGEIPNSERGTLVEALQRLNQALEKATDCCCGLRRTER